MFHFYIDWGRRLFYARITGSLFSQWVKILGPDAVHEMCLN